VKNWLEELFSETVARWWITLSGLSTLATFFFKSLSEKPRLVSVVSLILGFAWANFRVFQRQQSEIARLGLALSAHESRVASLKITPDEGSRYILTPVGNVPHADFSGGYFEFHLMVENLGRRNSTVNSYQVEVKELRQTFPNLKPIEGKNGVQGRHCQHGGMQPAGVLSMTGSIKIRDESATNHGTLLFHLPGINLPQFVEAGLKMHGEQKKFDALHCVLTLTDTTKASTAHEFTLHEE